MIGNRREEDQADLWLREHDPLVVISNSLVRLEIPCKIRLLEV